MRIGYHTFTANIVHVYINHDEGINDTVTRSCQTAANAQQAQNRHMEYPQYAAAWKSSTTR